MKTQNFNYPSGNGEKGVVLIVVLMVLLIVSVLGVMAYKRSTTDLRLATASQITQLMFQANDSAFAKVEKEDRIKQANNTAVGGINTLQGYMTRPGEQYVNAEVTFCVRPRGTWLFNLNQITEKNPEGNELNGIANGYCNVNNANDYVNEGRVMTQMTFFKSKDATDSTPLGGEALGSSSNDLLSTTGISEPACTYFTGYAVSLVPSYSTANANAINACLRNRVAEIDACLSALGVPHNVQIQTYKSEKSGAKCAI